MLKVGFETYVLILYFRS